MKRNHLAIFSGNAHRALAEAICNDEQQHLPFGKALVSAFSDGETRVEIEGSVRGVDTYIVQPTCAPVNQNLMELLVMVDALKRGSAGSITAVMSYYGYARQDRKVKPRTPITAKLAANLLQTAGVDRVVTVDLHAGQIQGFFDIPVDNVYATPVILPYLQQNYADAVVVSPDAGGVERALAYAKRLGGKGEVAVIIKRRDKPNESKVTHVIGEVEGRRCVILDDMFDTCGTLDGAAKALLAKGATSVAAAATHGVFSGKAAGTLMDSPLSEVIVTDTIPMKVEMAFLAQPPRGREPKRPKITTLPIAGLLAEVIRRLHNNDSLSSLFV